MSPYIYSFSRGVMNLVIRLLFRWRVNGLENLPDDGPVIVCANHRSYWDPPMIGCALPRKIHMMAKEELFRIPLFSWLIRKLGVFPVRRGKGDMASIRRAFSLLREGKVVGLFPEGRRVLSGHESEGQAGVALLAVRSGAPVVPVAIVGKVKLFHRVELRVGKPLRLSAENIPGERRSETLAGVSNRIIMARIREMVAEADQERVTSG